MAATLLQELSHLSHTVSEKRCALGEDGHAVLLLEEFKLDVVVFTSVEISILIVALVLFSGRQIFHISGLDEQLPTFVTLGDTAITIDLLALFGLGPGNLELIIATVMSFWFAFNLVIYLCSHAQLSRATLSAISLCFNICKSIILLRMLASDWTHPRISLAWKEIRLPSLRWNKGAKDSKDEKIK